VSILQPKAAVAVILHKQSNCVLLIRRPQSPQDPWSGHLAFPGGRIEPQDHSLLHTAMRETSEETGLVLNATHLVRELAIDYAGRSMQKLIAVQPYLFELTDSLPKIVPDPKEVAAFYWLSIAEFCQIERHKQMPLAQGLPNELLPCYCVENVWLWGFTYQILRKEFLSI
jgi:8-oxo-dGTP pyrophosphatase MutT (NUDIX family)